MIRIALVAALLAAAPACATPIDDVVAAYDALGQQTDADAGPQWPDMSKAAADRRTATSIALKAKLDALPPSPAGSEAALTRRLLDWRLGIDIEGARWDEDRIPFDNGDGFFNTANYAAANTVIRSEADATAWIARIRAFPAYYAQETANMRRGLATGFIQPRPTAASVLAILRIASDQPASASPLLAPFKTLPSTIPTDRQAALRTDALAAVEQAVKPAQRQMVAFFADDYVPHARTTLGASSLPDGKAYYAFTVRRSTTTDLTPDQIFALGEKEIARIHDEMEAQMRATGFTGTLPEFLVKLRTDKQFYAPDLETYIEKASEIGKRIDGLLPLWFGTLPRLPWTIRIKPPELEGSSGGYNLGDPAKGVAGSVVVGRASFGDPLFGLPAWILHEGVPGHHIQIALGQERTDLPAFRRRDEPTAFVEGWALYAEQLGQDMGVYRTPYEQFGRLSFDMWRACRLIMDVGIHMKGWSAEQAMRCLEDNTALPDRVVKGETQRYIAWPAQALAYKIGELQFLTERQRAEQVLGPRFDIRAFHDAVLDDGPMPLSVLHDQVSQWIARRSATPGAQP
ncbi:DUF885 domain-containing protein [Sphingomonas abietis]|uniref:DUF885 family protein n=1 Tax=Sphingomonas abietis TaxID=3012344 RepID=A0ABY7NRI5_9SPHN|nr:DUF885 family protein [Sphingomonas abietis]WBO23248.1 DUF885 family protein [Sphingomonas abietis]